MICKNFSDFHILYFIDWSLSLSLFFLFNIFHFPWILSSLLSLQICLLCICLSCIWISKIERKTKIEKKNQKRNHLSASRDAGSEIIQHDEDDDDEEEEEENSIDMDVDSDQLNEPLVIVIVVVECDQIAIVS